MLEKRKYDKKYRLKTTKFKGKALAQVSEFPFMITPILEKFGIKDDEDQEFILKKIEILVKKTKKKSKPKSKSSKKKDKSDSESGSEDENEDENESENINYVWD